MSTKIRRVRATSLPSNPRPDTLYEVGGQFYLGDRPVLADGGAVSTAWTTAWATSGQHDLGEQTISGPLSLTSTDLGSVVGGYSQAVLIADGANVPTFDGQALSDYNNTAGARNFVTLFRVGKSKFWSIGGALGSAIQLPTAPSISAAPIILSAIAGGRLTWVAPTAAGYPAPTIAYDVLVNGTVTAAGASSGAVAAPAAGSSVIVRATATNDSGSAQANSGAVTVVAAQNVRLQNQAGLTETGDAAAGWTYTHAAGAGGAFDGSNAGVSTAKIPAGQSGMVELVYKTVAAGTTPLLSLRTSQAVGAFATLLLGIYGEGSPAVYKVHTGSTGNQTPAVQPQVATGDVVRIHRIAGVAIKALVSKDGGSTFTEVNSWADTAGDLWGQLTFSNNVGAAFAVSMRGAGVA